MYGTPVCVRCSLPQVGPWADDAEAVVSVICGPGRTCRISFEESVFDSNTGTASGALLGRRHVCSWTSAGVGPPECQVASLVAP